jgi:hypothetical protein
MILLLGCKNPQLQPQADPQPTPYAFFVAGHAYGDPQSPEDRAGGLFPPFRNCFHRITDHPNMALGVLTGDVVHHSDTARWQKAMAALKPLGIPLYLAPGNHDIAGEVLHPRVFNTSYGYTIRQNDLFIFLDPEDQGWNIPQAQLQFLDTLLQNPSRYRNIFVFLHQVLWYDPNLPLEQSPVSPNNVTDRGQTINFEETLNQKLKNLPNPVWLFAGDVGAYCSSHEVTIHSEGNKHYLTSGMGCHIRSNYLLVEVSKKGEVEVEVIWLNLPQETDGGPIEKYRY